MEDNSGFSEQMPQTIGRYKVQESIGYGAMGAVYKAFDPLIKRTLAIKTIRLDIPRQSPQYKSFIDRFYHEARISGTLSHSNIVTLFDIGEEGGIPYLAMEFVEGDTISSMIEKGVRFKPEKVIGLVSQIASAVDYAHSKGVIHRDIKPSNLILFEGERVKVTDFGIAKLIDSEMTQSGTLLGTPSYMSPEQAMGDKLDGRSDIFSLGVCAFEMLSGEQPFPGANVTSILYKLVHVDPIEPANLEMHGLVPQKWHEVFGKVLAKKPDDRYQTATAFVQDLEYCLGAWFGSTIGQEGAAVLDALADAPATVLMKASPEPKGKEEANAPVTVLMAAPQPVDLTMRTPIPKAEAPKSEPPPRADEGETVRQPIPEMVKSLPTPPPPAPPAPRRSPEPAAEAPPPVVRPKGSKLGLILGAVALMIVGTIVLGGILVVRHLSPGPSPSPVEVLSTPPPPPTTVPPVTTTTLPLPTGVLHVESEPAGATVKVNGDLRGVTPLDVGGLAFGAYEVRLELKGFEARSTNLTLSQDSANGQVKLTLPRVAPTLGTADILSTPFGAAVTVDAKKVGQTPLTDFKVSPGSHPVQVTRDGYEPWNGVLKVDAGKRGHLDVTLKALPPPSPSPTPLAVDPNHVYQNKPSEVDTVARPISGSSASYPDKAPHLKTGESVSVAYELVVDDKGSVESVRVTESGGKIVDDAVVAALRKFKYSPAVKQGINVKVLVQGRQTFKMG